MKFKVLASLTVLSFLALLLPSSAATSGDVTAELKDLVGRINTKLQAGEHTEEALAGELKEFDALIARHQDEKTEQVAQALVMQSMLYIDEFDDSAKAIAILQRVQTEYAETTLGKKAGDIITKIQEHAAGEKIHQNLVPGVIFPDFSAKDTAGQPLSLAQYKGKIVLVDFWATWCPPCRDEIPNVVKVYQKYHAQDFEVIGISLDKEGDGDKLAAFTKENGMVWPQYFDGGFWENKLVLKYGVSAIPATYLLDGHGRIIALDLRGDALDAAVAKAIALK